MPGVQEHERKIQPPRVRVVRSTAGISLTPLQKKRIAHLPLLPVQFSR